MGGDFINRSGLNSNFFVKEELNLMQEFGISFLLKQLIFWKKDKSVLTFAALKGGNLPCLLSVRRSDPHRRAKDNTPPMPLSEAHLGGFFIYSL